MELIQTAMVQLADICCLEDKRREKERAAQLKHPKEYANVDETGKERKWKKDGETSNSMKI